MSEVAGAYVRVLYRGYSYGPLNVPSKLRIICNGLRISEKSVPALQRLGEFDADSEPDTEATTSTEKDAKTGIPGSITDFDAPIPAGLYRLLVAFPELPFLSEEIIEIKTRGFTDTRSFATQTLSSSVRDNGNVDTYTAQKLIQARDDELPLELEEMQASIDSMVFVIGTIPQRYIRYNSILSRNIENAKREVERLSKLLHDTNERYDKKLSLLSPGIQQTLIYYHMLNILVNCWNSVWIKFGVSLFSV